jgi:hypothetical protein
LVARQDQQAEIGNLTLFDAGLGRLEWFAKL